ncbi:MAG: flagellar biosynthetic protein FliO [Pseudomonadota bacterium]
MSQPLLFFFAFVAVLALIGLFAWGLRRFAGNRLGANTNRGRMPRLAVIDAAAVDGRRRLVLVRRDNIEHLLMIGGPTDIVVESNIVRAMPGREQAPRPAVGTTEPAPRIAPLPDTSWNEGETARADMFDHVEPQMPEPPPRPVRPSFADEVRRPAPPPMPERRPERAERIDRADPMIGFAPEPLGGRPEPRPELRPEPMPSRVTSRSEPMMPRPPRPEPPKAPPRAPAPERAVAPPPPAPPPPPSAQSSADQNLAEMAQRLEAALRRPANETVAPPVAPEPPQGRPAPRSEPVAPPAPAKSGFENLEDEMASLLGRPKNPS